MPINWRILATGATLLVFNELLFGRIVSFDSSTDVLGDGFGEIDDDFCRSPNLPRSSSICSCLSIFVTILSVS